MKSIIRFFAAITLFVLASCAGMNDNIQEYLDRGEINYIGKVDSASAVGGRERIRFTWKVNADPRIEQCVIYWNNRRDSASFPVNMAALDENRYTSEMLAFPEGTYIFSMYHTGSKGYRSIPHEVTGQSYGENYQTSLSPRRIFVRSYTTRAVLTLGIADADVVKTVLNYNNGGTIVEVAPNVNRVDLYDYTVGGSCLVTTYFRPEPNSMDEFVVESSFVFPEVGAFEVVQLDKDLFEQHPLPGDNSTQHDGTWSFELMWDGVIGNQGWHTALGVTYPVYFTIDLGVTTILSQYTLWQRMGTGAASSPYTAGSPKRWKVFGTDNPSAITDPAYWRIDGGFANDWVLLADCFTFRPSGLETGMPTQQDRDYAASGHTFQIPADIDSQPVRYVRFVVEEVWDQNSGNVFISELSFWRIVVD